MPISREVAVHRIAQVQDQLKGLGVKYLGLFGSVARDEATEDSDVDVLVDFDGPTTFDAYMDVKLLLEDVLQVDVDLVTRKALRDFIRESVTQDLVDVA